jgi:hypothetical protein
MNYERNPYFMGWCHGHTRHPYRNPHPPSSQAAQDFIRGYDDAINGRIDARAALGKDMINPRPHE